MSSIQKRKREEVDGGGSLLKDDIEFSRMDQPFPRGGGSVLQPLEIKRAAAEATSDVFDQMVKSKKAKRSKNKNTTPVVLGSSIEPLLLSKLRIGTQVLGKVVEINYNTEELIVSMPNNLTGYCKIDKDSIDVNFINTYLRFAVVEVGQAPHKKIQLDYSPDLVNQPITPSELTVGLSVQGTVESVEEKGILLNLGAVLGQGFLRLKDTQDYKDGFPILCFVSESEKRIKTLTLDPSTAANAVIEQPTLLPGTLIKSAPIERENSMGCVYDLLGHIKASSDAVHSQNSSSNWVRILFSYPPSQINGERKLGVSRLPHILNLAPSETDEIKMGKVFDTEVTRVCPNLGLFLSYGSSRANYSGFVHVSQITLDKDVKIDLEEDDYKVGTTHSGRVLSVSQLDGLAYFSFDKDVLSQPYMSLQEIQIGDIVPKATIDRILPKGGVLIRLSTGIVGIATEMQLSDVNVRNPEQRFKPGQRVSCRVLDVDLEKQRVAVTLKKSVVDYEGRILRSFDFPIGDETVGTVIKLIDAGALCVFFGDVRGLLPNSETSESGTKAQDILRTGQTVRVRVLDTDPEIKRLIVSMRPETQLLGMHINQTFTAKVSSKNKKETRVVLFKSDGSELSEATLVGSTKNMKVGDEAKAKVLTNRLVTVDKIFVDEDIPSTVDQLEIGQQVVGYVSGSHPTTGIFVAFAGDLIGLIPANLLGAKQASWPSIGKAVKVVVDTIDYAHKRAFLSLPSSSSSSKTTSVTITAVKELQLNVVTDDGQQGRIDASQVFMEFDEIKDVKKPLSQFKPGQKLDNISIIGRHDIRNHRFLPLSHRSGSHVMLEFSRLSQRSDESNDGSKKLAFVNNYSEDGQSLFVTLSPTSRGQLSLVDLSSDVEVLSDPESHYPVGSAIEVSVLKSGAKPSVTALTGPSNLALIFDVNPLNLMVRLPYHKTASISCVDTGDEFTKLKQTFDAGDIVTFSKRDSRITLRSEPFEPVTTGGVRKGFVSNIAAGGIFVSLSPNEIGRVKISQISDSYLKDWKSAVKIGDVVDCKVLSIKDGRIELSLKPSVVTGRKQPNIDRVEVGEKYSGSICRIETFGVFVEFNGVRGLCHHSEISDHPIDDLNRVFKVGDSVRIKVLAKDVDQGRLSLGMKAKYFEDDEESASDVEEDVEMGSASEGDSGELELELESEDEEDQSSQSENDEDDSSDDDESDSESSNSKGLSTGFDWSGDISAPKDDDSNSDSESDSDGEIRTRSKKKKEKFVRDETATMNSRLPESAKDFERLLVSTPGSSILWMNYMAFQLQLGEIDAARQIGRRALKSIPQKEEEERLNIWVALLNLETQFGTRESTESVFNEAQQFMDALTIYLRMATVYSEAGKLQEARGIFDRALKKFGNSSLEVWLSAMRFYFGPGDDISAGRALGERAIQRLPARLHRDFTKQFALLEFEIGDAERGRTLFEALIDAAPKRVDIWNVYIDQEIKQHDESKFSALFERVIQQRISMKQAKFFFKKWISCSSDEDYVKSRAQEYVENRNKEEEEENEEDLD